MKNSVRILAAKTTLAVALATSTIPITSQAGIPVIDAANVSQSMITALESVSQTLTQIEQYATQVQEYQTQMDQYELQMKNSLAPAASIWAAAQSTADKLMAAQQTLAYLENQLGGLDGYLDKFQNANYYRNSPCFTPQGCSESEMAAMRHGIALSNEIQKKTNDDAWHTIREQQKAFQSDSKQIEQLQHAADGAEGHLQAIGSGNQIASNQSHQLLQIRGLMLAREAADAARRQSEIEREAQYQANFESLYKGFKPTDRSKDKGF